MHPLWCNVFIVCQFAMLNFNPSIMQALKKGSSNLNCYTQKYAKLCNFVTHFVTNLSGEHVLFWKTHHSHVFNNPFSVLFSIQFSSPVRLLVIPLIWSWVYLENARGIEAYKYAHRLDKGIKLTYMFMVLPGKICVSCVPINLLWEWDWLVLPSLC